MSERRYGDEEVAAIFQAAAELQQRAALDSSASGAAMVPAGASTEGMTLGQLQEIGKEVGIPGDLVAQAAGSLDQRGRSSVRRFLGLPIGVGRTVQLPRRLSETEWERLVVDLRTTFDARGRLKDEGSFRQWTNGNLQALLEPTATGHQLRLKTMKGDAYASMMFGLATAGLGALLVAYQALSGPIQTVAPVVTIVWLGAAMFTVGALRLPGWARTRNKQMEGIVERLTQTTPAPGA
jgi:hypothetical protein